MQIVRLANIFLALLMEMLIRDTLAQLLKKPYASGKSGRYYL